MKLFQRFALHFGRWQELYSWLPALLVVMYVAYTFLFPRFDPRAGVDGWGALWGQFVVAFGAMLAGFLAWLIRRSYFLELTDEDERELVAAACGLEVDNGDGQDEHAQAATFPPTPCWQAVAILGIYHGLWLVVFYLLLSRLSP